MGKNSSHTFFNLSKVSERDKVFRYRRKLCVYCRGSCNSIHDNICLGAVVTNSGALQNRFYSIIRNISNISENIAGASTRIYNINFATETA
jgi:hypothetical protein